MPECSFRYKLFVIVLFSLAYLSFYQYPNMFSSSEASLLPLLAIDRFMPFLPASFLIYMSDYLIFIFVIFIQDTKKGFHHLSRMCFTTLFICGLFFIFYPTAYPRPTYPVVDNVILQLAMESIQKLDSPRNCFPSMHVALTGVATYSIRDRSKLTFSIFIIWTLLVYVSTLTTKQHYFVDIIGGIIVMVAVAVLDSLVLSKQRWLFPNI